MVSPAEVLALPWIQAIRPVRDPYCRRLSEHSLLEVWHVDVEFPRWPIPAELQNLWATNEDANARDTWRKRPLVRSTDPGCPYSCGEVELASRLRSAGFYSYWISEWTGFRHVDSWKDVCIKRNELKHRAPQVAAFDQRLREVTPASSKSALGRSGGHPDIVAWTGMSNDLVFLEYKGPGDSIKPKQDLWAQAAFAIEPGRIPYVAVMGTFTN